MYKCNRNRHQRQNSCNKFVNGLKLTKKTLEVVTGRSIQILTSSCLQSLPFKAAVNSGSESLIPAINTICIAYCTYNLTTTRKLRRTRKKIKVVKIISQSIHHLFASDQWLTLTLQLKYKGALYVHK